MCFTHEVKHTTVYTVSGGSFTAAGLKRIILILFKCVDYTSERGMTNEKMEYSAVDLLSAGRLYRRPGGPETR